MLWAFEENPILNRKDRKIALEAICATKVGTDYTVLSLDLLFVFSKEESLCGLMQHVDKVIITVCC